MVIESGAPDLLKKATIGNPAKVHGTLDVSSTGIAIKPVPAAAALSMGPTVSCEGRQMASSRLLADVEVADRLAGETKWVAKIAPATRRSSTATTINNHLRRWRWRASLIRDRKSTRLNSIHLG